MFLVIHFGRLIGVFYTKQVNAKKKIATANIWIPRVKNIMGVPAPQCQGGRVRLKSFQKNPSFNIFPSLRLGTPLIHTIIASQT